MKPEDLHRIAEFKRIIKNYLKMKVIKKRALTEKLNEHLERLKEAPSYKEPYRSIKLDLTIEETDQIIEALELKQSMSKPGWDVDEYYQD